jgi:hypothetical protein
MFASFNGHTFRIEALLKRSDLQVNIEIKKINYDCNFFENIIIIIYII